MLAQVLWVVFAVLAAWHFVMAALPAGGDGAVPSVDGKALFKSLGLFKRVRGSKFATLDTWVYSPLCLLLAAGVASVAWRT